MSRSRYKSSELVLSLSSSEQLLILLISWPSIALSAEFWTGAYILGEGINQTRQKKTKQTNKKKTRQWPLYKVAQQRSSFARLQQDRINITMDGKVCRGLARTFVGNDALFPFVLS